LVVPHIALPENLPGIQGVLAFKPSSGGTVMALVQQLLRGPGPLSLAERELIAAHVSRRNECEFCDRIHAATAGHIPGAATDVAAPGVRLRALLSLAGAVAEGGHHVTEQHVAEARAAGVVDEEIHDTVLIAACFCMVNRYVDGLGAVTPQDQEVYDAVGAFVAQYGYLDLAPAAHPLSEAS
jgi:uncharacterized peroxidase-related enzyme